MTTRRCPATWSGPAGAVPVPYNGSVARLAFGFLSASRVRRWLREGGFDVLHVHEPAAPSLSLLACWVADGPIVATVHTAIPRSRAMHAAEPILQSALEKINGRIAVSEAARTTLVEHFGGDAVLIPNGVPVRKLEKADPLPGWPGPGGALGFLGRMDEPRKGFAVLLRAFELLAEERPELRLLVAGPGDADEALARMPASLRDRIVMLGQVSDEDKIRVYHSVDVFCAPNTGGESFGIVLAEAMASGAPIVASDLEAFRQVLHRGEAGELFPTGSAEGLAAAAARLLDQPELAGGPLGGRVRGGTRLRLAGGGPGRGPRVRGRGARRRARRCGPGTAGGDRDHPAGDRGLVAIIGVYVSWPAGRLDRLHARVEAASARAGRRPGAAQLGSAGARGIRPARPGHQLAAGRRGARRQVGPGRPGAGAERPDPRAARRVRPARLP